MGQYRRKSTTVTAIQWLGENIKEIFDTFGRNGFTILANMQPKFDTLCVTTTNGATVEVRLNDWIIPDNKPDTFYPCDPEVFANTYDEEPLIESLSLQEPLSEITYHDENTLFKAHKIFLDAGLSPAESSVVINNLLNEGLFFRERQPK